jgi:hypothetical protein
VIVWSGGRRRYQPRGKRQGVVQVGSLVDSQQKAARDAEAIRKRLRAREGGTPATRAEAREAPAQGATRGLLGKRSVQRVHRATAKAIMRYLRGDSHIARMGEQTSST